MTTKFNNSITRDFAAVGEQHVAVCLLPGTEIAFDENAECEPSFGIGILPNKKIKQRLARFHSFCWKLKNHDLAPCADVQDAMLTSGNTDRLKRKENGSLALRTCGSRREHGDGSPRTAIA